MTAAAGSRRILARQNPAKGATDRKEAPVRSFPLLQARPRFGRFIQRQRNLHRAASAAVEWLEWRRLLTSIITVNDARDLADPMPTFQNHVIDVDPAMPGNQVSLRAALDNYADRFRSQMDNFEIDFSIGAGTPTIHVGSTMLGQLRTIDSNINDGFGLTINGNTGGATRVELEGSMAGAGADGLTLGGGMITIMGLVINRFTGNGIQITGSPPPGDGGNTVKNCYIGTDATGASALPNGGNGILIAGGTPNNVIGGTSAADRNVISGNTGDGIRIEPRNPFGPAPDANTHGTQVLRNYIGTNATGTAAVPNGGHGINIEGDPDATSLRSRPNAIGDAAGNGNVISGNAGDGVLIQGFFADTAGIAGNTVFGNWIGTDANGVSDVGNQANGVHIVGSPKNLVGVGGGGGNIISGNDGAGVTITLSDSHDNLVRGNSIGTNANGTGAIANSLDGVLLALDSHDNTAGGNAAGDGNLISGNTRAGVSIDGSNSDRVQNNTIGQSRARSTGIGNHTDGVSISDGSQNATVRDNAISGNLANGVQISGAGASQNSVLSNFIGSANAHNGGDGVRVAGGAATNIVSLNTIGNNNGNGVNVNGGTDTTISANGITGNSGAGVAIAGALNFVGAFTAAGRNIISGNFGAGVTISGDCNRVENNYIGTDAAGNVAAGNGTSAATQPGVNLNGATNTMVIANLISANTGAGVRVSGAAAANVIRLDQIGGNATGTATLGNGGVGIDLVGNTGVTPNDTGDGDTGPNTLQNFPVISSAVTNGGVTTITGTLNSTANATFTIEFFSNLAADPSGFGEGQSFIGSTTATTSGSGNASFSFVPASAVAVGRLITATATSPEIVPNPCPDPNPDPDPDPSNTSEFSQAVTVTGPVTNNASISGLVFNDTNGNGGQDAPESGIAARTVFIDANNNSSFDAGEQSATTNASGNYTLGSLAAGTYTVRQVLPSGWTQTLPASNAPYTVMLASGQAVSGRNFGARQMVVVLGSISGTVYNDSNGNGVRDAGESGLAGRTVYNDANNDKIPNAGESSNITNASGAYAFSNLAAGNYKIRQILPAGWSQTFPLNGFGHTIALAAGQMVSGRDFGARQATISGSISGNLFRDTNGNGIKDAGESAVGGRTVWIDLDNDKIVDANEQRTTTNQNGNYTLGGLGVGTYKVRQTIPAGWAQTIPLNGFGTNVTLASGQNATGRNFGSRPIVGAGSIAGSVFHDFNRNGLRDAGDSGISAWRVYIDTNNNSILDAGEVSVLTDSFGKYKFSSLAAATYKVREVLQSGFVQTAPANNFGINVTLASGQMATGKSFGVDN
jgi:hypothetical protein